MRVYVERDRSRLRIQIVYQGKKHQFSTGLTDTKTNRAHVQGTDGLEPNAGSLFR